MFFAHLHRIPFQEGGKSVQVIQGFSAGVGRELPPLGLTSPGPAAGRLDAARPSGREGGILALEGLLSATGTRCIGDLIQVNELLENGPA